MFDKLIESDSIHADFKPRRKFFMVSSVFVGILFLSAVMFSLYAQDLDLGTDNFEISTMLAPNIPDMPEPEPPREKTQSQQQEHNDQQKPQLPSRQALIARLDEPQEAPPVSTTPTTQRARPDYGKFEINPYVPDSDGIGSTGPARPGSTEPGTSSGGSTPAASEVVKADPPPVIKKETPKTQSKGVVNGIAIVLPKPPFPPTARAIGLTGSVNVQVLIDESGDVVSAKAVDGHAFFRPEAERAARKAKFKPTLLSDQPVKVSGVIVYRFSK